MFIRFFSNERNSSNAFIHFETALISSNVIVGDTLTRVLIYYAELDESSPWANRKLIISIACLCLTLPLSLGLYCINWNKEREVITAIVCILGNGMAKFAKFSLICKIWNYFQMKESCLIFLFYFSAFFHGIYYICYDLSPIYFRSFSVRPVRSISITLLFKKLH